MVVDAFSSSNQKQNANGGTSFFKHYQRLGAVLPQFKVLENLEYAGCRDLHGGTQYEMIRLQIRWKLGVKYDVLMMECERKWRTHLCVWLSKQPFSPQQCECDLINCAQKIQIPTKLSIDMAGLKQRFDQKFKIAEMAEFNMVSQSFSYYLVI